MEQRSSRLATLLTVKQRKVTSWRLLQLRATAKYLKGSHFLSELIIDQNRTVVNVIIMVAPSTMQFNAYKQNIPLPVSPQVCVSQWEANQGIRSLKLNLEVMKLWGKRTLGAVHQKNDVVNVPIKNGMSLRLKSYSFYVSSYTRILSEPFLVDKNTPSTSFR